MMGDNRKGYKGFSKGLICKDKHYAENTVFEESKAIPGKGRMYYYTNYYYTNPFNVLDCYDLVTSNGEFNDFAEVEALEEPETVDNKIFCTTKLKVGARLSIPEFIKACVDFTIEKTLFDMPDSKILENEEFEKMSGDFAQIGSSGNCTVIGSSGNHAKIGSSGDYAKIGSSGYSAQIESTGEDSVICCAGSDSIAKAKKGSWITLAEWEWSEEKMNRIPVCVKTEQVDGERIKADTFYKLVNGEFKEVEKIYE